LPRIAVLCKRRISRVAGGTDAQIQQMCLPSVFASKFWMQRFDDARAELLAATRRGCQLSGAFSAGRRRPFCDSGNVQEPKIVLDTF